MQWAVRSNVISFPADIFDTFPNLLLMDVAVGFEELSPADFEKALQLDYIELSKNKIRRVPANVFPKASKLKTIEMTSNQIEEIEENAFNGLNELETLTFKYNLITTLKRDTFAGTPKLRTIDLQDNEIAIIELGTFDLPRLDSVELGVNHLKSLTLPLDLFVNAPILRHIDFRYNDFTTLPSALFQNNVTIESLVLDYNQLQDFQLSELIKIKQLKYASFENTGIVLDDDVPIPKEVSQSLLVQIDLTSNAITTSNILKHLAIFGNLEIVLLNQNFIPSINDIANVRTLFPNITSISLEESEVDCTWLGEVLPALRAAEIELSTGSIDEGIPLAEQGDSVDGQLCGKYN